MTEAFTRRRPASLPPPLDSPALGLFSRGREALAAAARLAGCAPGRPLLLPDYFCGHTSRHLARGGLELDYYRVGEDLRPQAGELAAKAPRAGSSMPMARRKRPSM